EHTNDSGLPENVTAKEPDRVAAAPPKFLALNVYTVCPLTTPSVGVPVGMFVYPNEVIFTIGLWFTNATVSVPSGFAIVRSIVSVRVSPRKPEGAAVSRSVYRPSRRFDSRIFP